ncbi:MAG: hypothetical protein V4722_10765 [Bacteroidota bacterium]
MKKILTAIIAIALVTISSSTPANCQETTLNNNRVLNLESPAIPKPANETFSPHVAPYVSPKALKDFEENYKAPNKPQWVLSAEGGFAAFFADAGTTHRVFYNSRGKWQSTILRYDESKLDRSVLRFVMPSYYGYKINGVAEIRLPGKLIYLLYLQDATNFKTVRVCDDEMTEIEWSRNGKLMPL